MTLNRPWPTEIRLAKDRRHLTVAWDDGVAHRFTAEFLRTHSPSAEVQGHAPSQKVTVAGKTNVQIVAVEPVFDDLHATGIYGWDYFRELAANEEALWAEHLKALAAKGLAR
jgi:DUF971 family protein